MESDIMQSAAFYRAWAWFEKNKRQVIFGTVAVIVLGIAIYFFMWQKEQKEIRAGHALSAAFLANNTAQNQAVDPDAYLRITREHQGTKAAAQARLLAASALFAEKKYDVAQTEFQKYLQENSGNPNVPVAMLGVASALEALNKTNEALERYAGLVERYPTSHVLPQAKFRLARLREGKGEHEKALALYEDISKDQFGSLGNEAGLRAEEIKRQHPNLVKVQQPTGPVLRPATTNAAKGPAAATPAPKAKK